MLARKKQSPKKPKASPLSLDGMSFDEIMERIVRVQPLPKKKPKK